MRTCLLSIGALVVVGLLGADRAEALPTTVPLSDSVAAHPNEVRIARRRRPPAGRRARPRPKPKPTPQPAAPAAAPEPAPDPSAGSTVPMGAGGRARVDFDAQLIKGQTTKAGEVQILERKDTELKSMVKRRTSFRDEIILSVFPEKAGALK